MPRFKLRYEFLVMVDTDLYSLLDAVKIADVLLLLHPFNLTASQLTENLFINAVFAHFLPTTVHVAVGIEALPQKKRADIKKNVAKALETRFPDEKLHCVDKPADALQLLNLIGNCKKKRAAFKKYRCQVLAEQFKFEPYDDRPIGDLLVTGYVRTNYLNANQLIHIPGWGDFQMSMIEAADDPYPLAAKNKKSQEQDMDEDQRMIQRADPMLQEALETEVEPDPMDGEQTWPTKEEIAAAQAATQKEARRVPKGTSEYQAAWIIDDNEQLDDDEAGDDDEGESEEDDGDSGDECEMDIKPIDEQSSEGDIADTETINDEYETATVGGDDPKYDENMNVDEEREQMVKFKEAREEEMFPDEVDTPRDIPARERFARYRGLKSFNFSTWDPKENLPPDYARVFQFENFNRTRRRVLKQRYDDIDGAAPGAYVTIHVKNVPRALADHFQSNARHPLVLYGLLQHEQKMSVLNVVLKKHPLYTLPIKSKERLIFHVGCRRYYVNPVLSAHTNGNKFKYERFLRPDAAAVATFFAPITYAPASVTVFKEFADGTQQLAATGSLLSVNPDRLVIKRVVLSGHPFKISHRSAVVRYMFWNRDDIQWFKPVEMKTKYGRKGHIKEPLGTHGHMKCVFDRPIKSQDTVLMNLYKRVFPKWTFDPNVQKSPQIASSSGDINFFTQDQDMHE